jgi:hypothetical protein
MIRLVRETSLLCKSEVPSPRDARRAGKALTRNDSDGKPATLTDGDKSDGRSLTGDWCQNGLKM